MPSAYNRRERFEAPLDATLMQQSLLLCACAESMDAVDARIFGGSKSLHRGNI